MSTQHKKPHSFLWAGGIENTFINHPHPVTGKRLDEYDLTNHYDLWESDLSTLKNLPINSLRWGIPWYKANPSQGKYDFDWSERVIDKMLEFSIEPILDLVHYGTPDWLENSFLHPDYPKRIAEFTEAVLQKLGDRLIYVTPNNEPYTACEFCGLRGEWPPYGTGDSSFLAIMKQIGKGVGETCSLLQEYNKTAVHVEVASHGFTVIPELKEMADLYSAKQRLYWDMIMGKIDDEHVLYSWLLLNGWKDRDVEFFKDSAISVDIMGLNFYPQWSVSEFTAKNNTSNVLESVRLPVSMGVEAFKQIVADYWTRYKLPIMITETSVYGSIEEKAEWLKDSTAALFELQKEAVEIVGYTWFPVIDMINWDYKIQEGAADQFLIHLGLYDIERNPYKFAIETFKEIVKTYE